MVSIDKMQEEVDKATETLAKLNEIDVYCLLYTSFRNFKRKRSRANY